MTETLKPCPFCGGENRTASNRVAFSPWRWIVLCEDCGVMQGGESYEEACAAWNRRAAPREPGEADLRDAITSMTALEDELNVTATFSYGDDADEIAFTGSDALDCCRQFIAWYRAVGAERGRPQDSQPAAGIARAQQTVAEDATADQPDVSSSGESDAVPSTPMPDTPALAALREAEREAQNEVLHLALRLANWDPPSVMDRKGAPLLDKHARALAAYRDAVAARVREELLASGTKCWAATGTWSGARSTVFSGKRPELLGDEFFPPADGSGQSVGVLSAALTPPGTCRRAVLTILPEEGEG